MKLELSVIVPFAKKDESRLPALKQMLDCIKAQDLRVHGTDIKNWEFIFVEQINPDTSNYNVIGYTKGIADNHIFLEYQGAFNKSWCMNVGARVAKSEWLCFIDADMLFGKEYLYFAHIWKSNIPIKFFVGWDTIIKLPGKSEPVARLIRNTVLTAGGVFWCNKDFYWELGGMNENYFGYGGEDNDFWARVNVVIGESKNRNNVSHCPYPMVHVYHDDAIPSPERFYHLDRTVKYPQEITKRLITANLGKTKGPTVIDVSDLQIESSIADTKSMGIIQ